MATSVSLDSCDLCVYEDSFSLNYYEKPDVSGNSLACPLLGNNQLESQDPYLKDLSDGVQSCTLNDRTSVNSGVPGLSAKCSSNDKYVVNSSNRIKSFTSSVFSENHCDFEESYGDGCSSKDDNYKLVELTSVPSQTKSVQCKNSRVPIETNLEVVDEDTVVALTRVLMSGLDGNYKFHCSECSGTFPCRLSIISHLTSHAGFKAFHCTSCDSLSSSETEAKLHYRSHSRDGAQPSYSSTKISNALEKGTSHACPQCEVTFESTESLSSHMEIHVRSDDTFSEEHVCLQCGEEFTSLALLQSHEKSFHLKSIEILVPDKNNSLKNFEGKGERKWICQTCEKAFRSSRALREHQVVHTGARDFPCQVCGKAFGTATNMRIHLLTHSDQRPFTCQTCGATFRQKDSLKVHERKHSGDRPFVCTVCQMAFDRNFTLKNHMLKHTEKSFVCSVCGKAFSTRGGLINHERLHFKEPTKTIKEERPPRAKSGTGNWICDECGKIYSTRSNLKIHQKSHEPTQICHVCPVCSQSYKTRDSMEVHMRRHTEERPFKCTMCSRSFYRNYTLKIHILTHTGEKPHTCPIEGCKKSFAQTSSLSYHVRNHKKREERDLNQCNSKRPYRKKKTVLDNNLSEEMNNYNINLMSSPMKSDKGACGSDNDVPQDLKLGLGSLMSHSVSGNSVALTNTSDDTVVQSMLDDISNSMAHQMDHALPAIWDDSENIAMLGVVNGLHNPSQHPTLGDITAMGMGLQQHCQEIPLMQFIPTEVQPLMVGAPDSVLYQQDSVHKVLAGHSMIIPHLP